jgi:SAM-dependent methyltransferase
MAHPLKRLLDDVTGTWRVMPKSQALRWYAAMVRHAPQVVRERKFYSADAEMRGVQRFHILGRDFAVDVDAVNSTPGNGYAFLREMFVRQIYFRAFRHLNFKTCLDLGCNTGVVSSILNQIAGAGGRVVGIDPLTYPESSFRAYALTLPGLTIDQRILCGESVRNNPAKLEAVCVPYGFDPARAATMREVLDAHQLDHVDFMKVDIEGAEFDIFRDSYPWLERVDNLAMEVHNQVGDPGEIIRKLQDMGFRVSWLDDNGYQSEPRQAGYIYASKVGALKNQAVPLAS